MNPQEWKSSILAQEYGPTDIKLISSPWYVSNITTINMPAGSRVVIFSKTHPVCYSHHLNVLFQLKSGEAPAVKLNSETYVGIPGSDFLPQQLCVQLDLVGKATQLKQDLGDTFTEASCLSFLLQNELQNQFLDKDYGRWNHGLENEGKKALHQFQLEANIIKKEADEKVHQPNLLIALQKLGIKSQHGFWFMNEEVQKKSEYSFVAIDGKTEKLLNLPGSRRFAPLLVRTFDASAANRRILRGNQAMDKMVPPKDNDSAWLNLNKEFDVNELLTVGLFLHNWAYLYYALGKPDFSSASVQPYQAPVDRELLKEYIMSAMIKVARFEMFVLFKKNPDPTKSPLKELIAFYKNVKEYKKGNLKPAAGEDFDALFTRALKSFAGFSNIILGDMGFEVIQQSAAGRFVLQVRKKPAGPTPKITEIKQEEKKLEALYHDMKPEAAGATFLSKFADEKGAAAGAAKSAGFADRRLQMSRVMDFKDWQSTRGLAELKKQTKSGAAWLPWQLPVCRQSDGRSGSVLFDLYPTRYVLVVTKAGSGARVSLETHEDISLSKSKRSVRIPGNQERDLQLMLDGALAFLQQGPDRKDLGEDILDAIDEDIRKGKSLGAVLQTYWDKVADASTHEGTTQDALMMVYIWVRSFMLEG